MTGRAVVLRGDAAHLPLPDASVDLIVTSPPYFGLRSYTDGGEHYAGQIGSEATPAEFVAALAACTAEWVRVLKPSGSLFVNLGDKYAGVHPGAGRLIGQETTRGARAKRRDVPTPGIRDKSLMGLPWRYALACMDDLGLILRRDVIWSKPNGLPESVTDRCRSSHEYVFHLVRQPQYYAAVDEIREPHESPQDMNRARAGKAYLTRQNNGGGNAGNTGASNPLGKLPGSVWDIPSQPLLGPSHRLVWDGRTERWFATEADAWEHMRRLAGVWGRGERAAHRGRPSLRMEVDHFAAYPMDLPRRCILGWSPPGVCTACGEGRRPVSTSQRSSSDAMRPPVDLDRRKGGHHGMGSSTLGPRGVVATITGYACACPAPTAPTRPAVVLDPCGGTGTTAVVAAAYGRVGITVDRSQDYSRFARWRTSDPGQQAQAGQRVKPPPARPKLAAAGQGTLDALFGMDGAAS